MLKSVFERLCSHSTAKDKETPKLISKRGCEKSGFSSMYTAVPVNTQGMIKYEKLCEKVERKKNGKIG